MDVNGVTSVASSNMVQAGSKTETAAVEAQAEKTSTSFSEEAAVFEKSEAAAPAKTYTPNTDMVAKLKADAEARTSQLQDIVNKLLTKQAGTYNAANGLKSLFENLEVDEATRAQAEKDIADDGYWGVDQTSSRIFDFAMALSGGDPDKMEQMRDAFTKGFKQATGTWGADLPDISQRTAEAVYQKFDDYKKQMEEQTAGTV
ncbi:MAG: hypothetical protein MJ105_05875 [Lachnospiraceae bacterium]|nr:hypothetical protein [Lachnospiraceae bacterium]